MKQNGFISQDEKIIASNDPALQYMGRIDFDDPLAPVFVYPYTSVRMRFTGTRLKIIIKNKHLSISNYLGYIIDGNQHKILITEHGKTVCVTLAEGLENCQHEIILFKRMDSCHMFAFEGFVVGSDANVSKSEEKPARKIEVYGDSISAGEVSEAIDYIGKSDPEHNGEYSNAYFSYAAMTARKLHAQIHDIAQGGISLLNGTGWFAGPNYIGIEDTWDKIEYNPEADVIKKWDFSRYTPHVVLVAIGQNDSNPQDYMKDNYESPKAKNWRIHYEKFIRSLRKTYPKALIILATTIMMHDENWDRSIDEVCKRINDEKIVHFLYSRNGCGTPGHIRIQEAEKMSDELSAFINSFGEKVWQ